MNRIKRQPTEWEKYLSATYLAGGEYAEGTNNLKGEMYCSDILAYSSPGIPYSAQQTTQSI